jgi:hypothetical protein
MIQRLETFEQVIQAVQQAGIAQTFFASPEMLHTFLNKPGFQLYSLAQDDSGYLFVHKERTKELRLLFRKFPQDAIDQLRKTFSAPYIAYNELQIDPLKEHETVDEEVYVDIDVLLSFADGDIRRKYHKAKERNAALTIRDFKDSDREELKTFWGTWSTQKSERSESFVSHTHHDERFFELFDGQHFFGKVFYDGNTLVGYSIALPLGTELCIGAFSKCLRGYHQLGMQLFIERAIAAQERGYQQMSIAVVNNDFKKQFVHAARYEKRYAYEVWRSDNFQTKTPHGYTNALLR